MPKQPKRHSGRQRDAKGTSRADAKRLRREHLSSRLAVRVGALFLGLTSEAITCRRSATGGLRGASFLGLTSEAITCRRSATGGFAWALRSSDSRPRLAPAVAPRLADCMGASFLGLTSEAITCRRSATGGSRGRFVPRTDVRGYHLSSLRDWRIAWRFVPRTHVRGYHLSSLRDWRIRVGVSFLGLTSEAITCRRSATGGSRGHSFLGLTSEAITCRRSATGGLRGRFVPRTHVRGYHLSSLRDWRIAWTLRSSD